MDPQILLFRRQYFQLFEPNFLAWPPKQLLNDSDVQAWLYNNMFNSSRVARLPPERYQMRVLKPLVAKIESSVDNPEEDEVSDELMSYLAELLASQLPSESVAVQQKSYVSFTCTSPDTEEYHSHHAEPTVTLLERRYLIAGSRTTGFRTWEAALHLGSFLLTKAGTDAIRGKNVLELGAGTGFISMLCAKHLQASYVTSTDGDEGVVEALRENMILNQLDDGKKIEANVLSWGTDIKDTWLSKELESRPLDVILGADITYEKGAISALIATLRSLFDTRPQLQVFISGAIRNTETFDYFRETCSRNAFEVSEIDYEAKPMKEQVALFYATAVPLKIVSIRRPQLVY